MKVYVIQYYAEVLRVCDTIDKAADFLGKRLGIEGFKPETMVYHNSHGSCWTHGNYSVQEAWVDMGDLDYIVHVYGPTGRSYCGASAGLPTVSVQDRRKYPEERVCPNCRRHL